MFAQLTITDDIDRSKQYKIRKINYPHDPFHSIIECTLKILRYLRKIIAVILYV